MWDSFIKSIQDSSEAIYTYKGWRLDVCPGVMFRGKVVLRIYSADDISGEGLHTRLEGSKRDIISALKIWKADVDEDVE